MKGCKTIAEYMVKKWMESNGFVMSEFSVKMIGDEAEITDRAGDKMTVLYNQKLKSVQVK